MYVVCSVSYPILKPLIMSFCTQGLPGVAESNASLSEGNLLPGERAPARADEWWGKVFLSGPHPPSSTVPPLQNVEGYFG